MRNDFQIHKENSTPAWHVSLQAFLALFVLILLPLVFSAKSFVVALLSPSPEKETPKEEVASANPTFARFLATVVFGVGEENIVMNEETGEEHIILPYGGNVDSGGNISAGGAVQSGGWTTQPTTDGSFDTIRSGGRVRDTGGNIPSGGDISNGGTANAGGNVPAGGGISSGGSISAGGSIPSGGSI